MQQATPAIVAQGAVSRLPRVGLWLFCLSYVLAGFLGRDPWKHEDLTAFGYMAELAAGTADWLHPTLGHWQPEVDALLPYWLGAWAIESAAHWLPADLAARLPFMLLLVITLAATWYGTYYLARSPLAQPAPFAFGGEAQPTDYARAIADGGLLAFIACLGLAQLSHETTPALAQLCFSSLLFYAAAALPYRRALPLLGFGVGCLGLTLSGAPALALFFGTVCALLYLVARPDVQIQASAQRQRSVTLLFLTLLNAIVAMQLNLWHWRVALPEPSWAEWQSQGRLFLWFTWPAWPLAFWTLWRWRHQWLRPRFMARHIWLPLCFALLASACALSTAAAERSLLLALPALAALAAFALPTLSRAMSALIDWFTLIFFSGCAVIIWLVWISMQTGIPAQPAANVVRLAPGFVHNFSFLPFALASCATLGWAWLVKWRVGRHRSAIWKSVILPAGGAALCWLLLMTLWLPLLDYARSYAPLVRQATELIKDKPTCVATLGLTRSQTAAYRFHGRLTLEPLHDKTTCAWLLADGDALRGESHFTQDSHWQLRRAIGHPAERRESMYLYARSD